MFQALRPGPPLLAATAAELNGLKPNHSEFIRVIIPETLTRQCTSRLAGCSPSVLPALQACLADTVRSINACEPWSSYTYSANLNVPNNLELNGIKSFQSHNNQSSSELLSDHLHKLYTGYG
jgi:hypothetical protein